MVVISSPAGLTVYFPVIAVYLLDEILEISRFSPETAQGVAEHLVARLAHKSPTVKFKVTDRTHIQLPAHNSS